MVEIAEMGGLPPLYARWMAELLAGPIPDETAATCDRCAMCVPDAARSFRPDTKCCTFLPTLHNFLVGRALADTTPESAAGRATVIARMQKKVGVNPLGLGPTRAHNLIYEDGGHAVFGKSRALLCPHYLDGMCGVWKHRESTCATWFCKYVRGKVGQTFWRSIHQLLAIVERDLAWWCLAELDFDVPALAMLLESQSTHAQSRKRFVDASELDGREAPHYAAVWGSWLGREESLFRECAGKVDALAWADVVARAGADAQIAARIARTRYAELVGERTPVAPKAGAFQILAITEQTCRIDAYSEYDAIELPRVLLELLPSFDGRALDEVLAELADRHGITLDAALVRRLADYGVLVE